MRTFLSNLNIVGSICVWSEGEIIRHSIENLIKYCDKLIIIEDNPDEKTHSIVLEYLNAYPDIIVVGQSGLRSLNENEKLENRWITLEDKLFQSALDYIKLEHQKRPIDILLFMDSDEILTKNLPNLLEKFINSKADTIFTKPIEVYDSMNIIVDRGLCSHAKIYKYRETASSIGRFSRNYLLPYCLDQKILRENWGFVHLARLTKENRELRNSLRNRKSNPFMKLRRISKSAEELTPLEAEKIINDPEFLYLKDYDGDINKVPLVL